MKLEAAVKGLLLSMTGGCSVSPCPVSLLFLLIHFLLGIFPLNLSSSLRHAFSLCFSLIYNCYAACACSLSQGSHITLIADHICGPEENQLSEVNNFYPSLFSFVVVYCL